MMKRTTVMLPEEVDDLLRHEAERKGMTMSQLTREAIEEYLGIRPRRKFLSAGAGSSGGQNLASRVDEVLAEEGFGDWRS
jgi:hypothetical protein